MLKSTVNLNVRVEPKLAERLEKHVSEFESKTQLVSEALSHFIDHLEKKEERKS